MNLKCNACGAEIVIVKHMLTTQCPYCGSNSVIERPADEASLPAFILNFEVDRETAGARIRDFLRQQKGWLTADLGFIDRALEHQLKGFFVPAFLYSACSESRFNVSIGENYERLETSMRRGADGRTIIETQVVTYVEWRKLIGRRSEYIPDVVVTASRGVSNESLEQIEPFDLGQLQRYDASLLGGWPAEAPTRQMPEIQELARAEAVAKLQERMVRDLPGDSFQDLVFSAELQSEAFEQVLVPIWSLHVRQEEGEAPIRLLVNGQTGLVQLTSGELPTSSGRVLLLVLAVLLVVGGLLLFLSSCSPGAVANDAVVVGTGARSSQGAGQGG